MGRFKKQLKSKSEKINIKKNDQVVVVSGEFRNKGKKGKVLDVDRNKDRVLVEGIKFVKRHQRPNQQIRQGGIIEKESAIHVSNVMPFCEKCEKGVRLNRKRISSGDKEIYVRCCAECGEMFDKI
jgi:large subunit ribosomal protein L24